MPRQGPCRPEGDGLREKGVSRPSSAVRIGIALLLLGAGPGRAEPAPVIRSITVQGPSRTRESVIRRELLFAVGQPLDSARVAETARNLRGLLFLGRVDIRTRVEGGSAEVRVEVEDLYARAISPLLSGKPGELSYGVTALDYNLFGRGQILEVTLEHRDVTGDQGSVAYRHPRWRDTRNDLEGSLRVGSEGHQVTASASRPFYRLSARWGYTASADVLDWRQRRYAGGAVSESYTERTRTGGATLVRSFGSRWKVRPEIGVRIIQSLFEAEAGYPAPPGDRRRVLPAAGLTLWRPRYETTRFLFGLGRTEDIQTGSWGSLSHGFSSRLLGSDREYGVLQVRLVPILRPREGAYAFLHARLRASYDRRRFFDLYASSGMSLYARLGEASLLAVRVQGEILGRPEDRSQLLLGLDEGLRGYVPRRFDGTRRVRLNLEARPTLLRRPAFVIAAAAFADGGAVWTPGLTRRRTSYAAGGGLRLGLPRVYNSPILRADLARGFRDRAWQLALGLGQYF